MIKTLALILAISAPGGAALAMDDYDLLGKVNRDVNARIEPMSDMAQYGTDDVWVVNPASRKGDCEDYALTKRAELMRAGVPASDMFVQVVRIPVNVAARMAGVEGASLLASDSDVDGYIHAVLVVRTPKGFMVLDNLTNRVREFKSTGYRARAVMQISG